MISDKSEVCIHCGYPIKEYFGEKTQIIENVYNSNENKKDNSYYERPTQILPPREEKPNGGKVWFWVVLVVIAMFAGCNSCTSSSEPEEEYVEIEENDVEESIIEIEEVTVIEEETEEPQTEVAEIPMEEYIAQCQEYNYKDVLRNPSDYVGQKVKITVKISSVHEASWLYNNKYYFAYSNDEYDMYLGDRYAIIDKRYDNSLKLLDEDIILVYGEIAEPESTKSYIVNSEELFTIDMRYVELLGE